MADLTTLTTVKTLLGIPNPNVPGPDDAKYANALEAASALVRGYAQRTFEVTEVGAVPTSRTFEYDGNGYLDIDDAHSIISVSIAGGWVGSPSYSLSLDEWAAYPVSSAVKAWIRLPQNYWGIGSPEMGFTRNMDQLWYKYPFKPSLVTVTATWGWDTIPADVQRATAWTAIELSDKPLPYQSESIANYSRTRGPNSEADAIPERAKAALAPYIIPSL